MTKDRRLGKGLAALLGTPLEGEAAFDGQAGTTASAAPASTGETPGTATTPPTAEPVASPSGSQLLELSVYEIDNNPFQPRRQFNSEEIASLAESLKAHEQLQPLLVRRDGQRYQLISGERRLRAAIHAGMSTVKAEVRDADDRLVAELAIIENLQRKDLNAVEKAMSFRRYIQEHSCTQEELAQRLKIDRSTIANLMRLLELPQEVLDAIGEDQISAGHARALLPLGDEDQQQAVTKLIVDEQWSVRQTERHVAEIIQSEDDAENGEISVARKPSKKLNPQISSLEQRLRIDLGTKVEIKEGARGRGKIVVHFSNPEEFERITEMIRSEQAPARAA